MDPSSQMGKFLEDCIRNRLGKVIQGEDNQESREHMKDELEQVEGVYRE